MRGKPIDPNVKAKIIASLLLGQSMRQVALTYKVGRATVARFRAAIPRMKQEGSKECAIAPAITLYVENGLKSLDAQLKQVADPEWLQEQSAKQTAILHGVIVDRALRIIDALALMNQAA